MHKLLLDLPTRLETERLYLRPYQAGDGQWLYPVSQANRAHLTQYEAGNVLMSIKTPEDAEVVARDLANAWAIRLYRHERRGGTLDQSRRADHHGL